MSDNSSDNSKTVMVVAVLGIMLVLMCAIVPVGVGAMMYFRLREETVAAQRAALAAEQEARAQAEVARAEAARALAQQLANPPVAPQIPIEAAPAAAPSELTLEQRKTIYLAVKAYNDQLAVLEEAAKDEPAVQELLTVMKSQREAALEQVSRSSGITRQKLDEIVAEGEREKW